MWKEKSLYFPSNLDKIEALQKSGDFTRQVTLQKGDLMISQRLRNFKLGTLHQTQVTGSAGMALILTFAQDLGLGQEFDRLFSHLKKRQRGYSVSAVLLSFLRMVIQGGDRLNDLDLLDADPGLLALTRMSSVPRPNTVADLARKFRRRDVQMLAEIGMRLAVQALLAREPKRLILDIDSTLIPSDMRMAKMTYDGFRGFNPLLGMVRGGGLNLPAFSVFRLGNEAPQEHNVSLVRKNIRFLKAHLPKTPIVVRSDSAGYNHRLMGLCDREGVGFVIGGRETEAIPPLIRRIRRWEPLRGSRGKEDVGETVHFLGSEKEGGAYRLVVVRRKKDQGALFPEYGYSYRLYVTNTDWSRSKVVRFYRKRGDAENVIKELKDGFGIDHILAEEFLAAAALRLVGQGVLRLDEDVNAKLSSWKVPANEFTAKKSVTLREILSHSAGLTVHGFLGYPTGGSVPTLLQVLDGVKPANSAPIRVDVLPGSLWRYSGGGYTVLQQLLIDVLGKPFPEIMKDSVLIPAGLSQSTFEQPLPADRLAQSAVGYKSGGKPVEGLRHVYPEMAAAGLWTTPTDLGLFALEIMNAFNGRSDRILSREMAGQMLTVQKGPSGLGFMLEGEGADFRFSHSGGNEGFICNLIAYPAKGALLAVMTNADGGGTLCGEFLRSLAAEYGLPGFASVEKAVVAVAYDVLDAYAGKYEVDFSGQKIPALVSRTGDHLAITALGSETELLPESATKYFALDLSLAVEFERNARGRTTGLTVNGQYKAKKIEKDLLRSH